MSRKEIYIFVNSSRDPNVQYEVRFIFNNNKLSVDCSCSAGLHDKNCKHKTELILNNPSICFEDIDRKALARLHEQPEIIKLKELYDNYVSELVDAENKHKIIRNKIDRIKRSYANTLRDGVPI